MLYGCPNCGKDIEVGDGLLGKQVTCPACKFAISSLIARRLADELRQKQATNIHLILGTGIVLIFLFTAVSPLPSLPVLWHTIVGAGGAKPAPVARSEPPDSRSEERGESKRDEQPKQAPEPSALALLGAGAVGVAIYAWRRRRNTLA